jgi:hypothetical protein
MAHLRGKCTKRILFSWKIFTYGTNDKNTYAFMELLFPCFGHNYTADSWLISYSWLISMTISNSELQWTVHEDFFVTFSGQCAKSFCHLSGQCAEIICCCCQPARLGITVLEAM